LGRTAFTGVNVRSESYSGDIVKKQEKGKGERRQVRESEGRKKKKPQCNK